MCSDVLEEPTELGGVIGGLQALPILLLAATACTEAWHQEVQFVASSVVPPALPYQPVAVEGSLVVILVGHLALCPESVEPPVGVFASELAFASVFHVTYEWLLVLVRRQGTSRLCICDSD